MHHYNSRTVEQGCQLMDATLNKPQRFLSFNKCGVERRRRDEDEREKIIEFFIFKKKMKCKNYGQIPSLDKSRLKGPFLARSAATGGTRCMQVVPLRRFQNDAFNAIRIDRLLLQQCAAAS
ncbi:hypothetical protein T11_16465 [Trichinella zimbabwensis]|uniref:Uncharacterized protein n=1 Tax=Trichinella zimbabwensis TaxID=268475 RepID=A0A0V1I6V7_9BILA|nr:hypothetical protein T11_16465 [Trichinella zimbabwensis]